ncbi:hypothetical protein [Serpentinicella alkaliphila]|uniref:Multicomponent Na+:H+ antiporter subunit B n=1 Tax=Serpentinicella alkaliphila TaxID=1734049 RepID=A0A4R2TUJ2_9FIRM|nr:hypothetical protein [Serpentinicella alkaliphila]QUH25652.1 hypothetical protein HZR23_07810 [Serpentinicella alkaliphila]TCQ06637.1 multicomponent Na+:H+ antiporter subunit B [Serpentinicella alkaliphila]
MKKFFTMYVLVCLLIVMIAGILEIPAIGDPNNPSYNEVALYYIENAVEDTKSPNAVTAVLKYYRGTDTLLEAGVLFTSIVAVMSVLRGNKSESKKEV